ncbi:MAG: NrsF family protein [Halioglobus sp.]
MSKHDAFIDALSSDLAPTGPPRNISRVALVWLVLSAAYVLVVGYLLGPIRPDALTQFLNEPRFALESLLGALAIAMAALCAFRAAIPGAHSKRLLVITSVLMILWIVHYAVGIISPTLAPSMLGKREHCSWETWFYATPPALAAMILVRGLYPLQPARTAAGIGLAAGMIPALYMQFACMYEAKHILEFHILPGIVVAALCFAVVACWTTWGSGLRPNRK